MVLELPILTFKLVYDCSVLLTRVISMSAPIANRGDFVRMLTAWATDLAG